MTQLYNIEKLHQTTTFSASFKLGFSCIILKNYIKPQHLKFTQELPIGCIILKNYIKPQQNDEFAKKIESCIILKNYIKPQHNGR